MTAYVDEATELDFEEILRLQRTGKFKPADQIKMAGRFENGKYRYWAHFVLKNNTADSLHCYYRGNSVDSATVYIQGGGEKRRIVHTGRWTHGAENTIRFPFSSRLMVPLTIPPQRELQCWVRMMNEYGFNDQFYGRLYHPDFEINQYAEAYLNYRSFLGGFFVILLFLLVFNGVLFLQNRNRIYFWYAAYLFFLFLYYLRESSYFDHFAHTVPIFLYQYRFHSLFGTLMFISYYLFIGYFIDTKQRFPVANRFLRLLIAGTGLLFVISQIAISVEPNLGYQVTHYVRYVMLVVHLLGLGWLLTTKDKMARYALIGTSFLLVGATLTFLESYFGWLNDKWWDADQVFAYVGIFIEVLFFTVVLGYRQFMAKKEKLATAAALAYQKREAEQLKSLDRMKTAFFTDITHELKTPLTVIKGMTEEITGNQEAKRAIVRNSRHLLRLINGLLDLARIEVGKMPLYLVQDDLIAYVKYLVASLDSLAGSEQLDLVVESESITLEMDFDPDKIRSVLYNLIGNAIKFSPDGGEVRISIREKISESSVYMLLEVSDKGAGIVREDLPHIFDKFFRSAATRNTSGTGVGLALTKEFVELHGGTIEVKSLVGHGTTFTVALPIHNNAARVEAVSHIQRKEPVREESIDPVLLAGEETILADMNRDSDLPHLLIVEDNADIVHYLLIILEGRYKISVANDGAAGVELALAQVPDLIISDVVMPKLTGFDLLATLKSDERTSHIPIVLLTAKTAHEDKIKGLEYGADAYLHKPFEKDELLVRLKKLNELRELLRSKYANLPLVVAPEVQSPETESPTLEDLFLHKLNATIRENVADERLDTHFLCRKLGMSKTQLYRKLKALTGHSIANYIRHYRLEMAYGLLKKPAATVSEVAYEVGFSSLSWFSQAFRGQYGCSPSDVVNV